MRGKLWRTQWEQKKPRFKTNSIFIWTNLPNAKCGNLWPSFATSYASAIPVTAKSRFTPPTAQSVSSLTMRGITHGSKSATSMKTQLEDNMTTLITSGDYTVKIKSAELKRSIKCTENMYIDIKYEIQHGEFKNEIIHESVITHHVNEQARMVGLHTLNEIITCASLSHIDSTDQIIGTVLNIKVTRRETMSGDFLRIVKHYALDSIKTSKKTKQGDVQCKYCGSIFDSKKYFCHSCGAPHT